MKFDKKYTIDPGFKEQGRVIISGFMTDINNSGFIDIVLVTKNTKDTDKVDIWVAMQSDDPQKIKEGKAFDRKAIPTQFF